MTIIVAILALGLLIVLHEAGHFLAARWCGMRVYEFSIGFGPKIWSIKRGDTEYSLRVIFLGGYVRVAGMHPAEEDVDAEGSFLRSAPWKRFLMISAGPIANYLTAIALFIILFATWGVRDNRVQVRKTPAKSAAGLLTGDRILSINGTSIQDQPAITPLDSFVKLAQQHMKGRLILTILRDGKQHKVTFPKLDAKSRQKLGLKVENQALLTVKSVKRGSNAAEIGLLPGDQLLSIDKQPLSQRHALLRAVRDQSAQGFVLRVRRKSEVVRLQWPKGMKPQAALGLTTSSQLMLQVKILTPGSLAQAAGLEVGDVITAVNDKALQHQPYQAAIDQVMSALTQCRQQNKPLSVLLMRQAKEMTLQLQPQSGGCAAGIAFRPTIQIAVIQTQKNSTAANIGLQAGDRIIAIDGNKIVSLPHLLKHLSARIYRPIKLQIERSGKQHTLTAPMAKDAKSWKLGFAPQLDFPRKRSGILASVRSATLETWRLNALVFGGFARLFQGRAKAEFTGPIGIVQMARTSFKRGMDYFLRFVAFISISLAFFNLIPFPALDGGRLMFLFLQQILRLFGGKEELGVRIEMVANLIGIVLLFGLLIFISFKDILR